MTDVPKKLHRIGTVAAALDVSESLAKKRYKEWHWPHMKVGRCVRFTDEHVAQIIAMHSRNTGTEQPAPAAGELRPSSRRRTRRSA